jgi:hypothetical protein
VLSIQIIQTTLFYKSLGPNPFFKAVKLNLKDKLKGYLFKLLTVLSFSKSLGRDPTVSFVVPPGYFRVGLFAVSFVPQAPQKDAATIPHANKYFNHIQFLLTTTFVRINRVYLNS